MPAKNIYHDAVVRALTADGWTVTDDPLTLTFGTRDLYVDLAAERVTVAAEKGEEKIAVEVASFLNPSPVRDLQLTVGQYEIYRILLARSEPDRLLYLAVPLGVYEGLLSERFGNFVVTELNLRVLVFDPLKERITRWIN